MSKELFGLGRVLATPGALEAMKKHDVAPSTLLGRHVTGDWGDVCDEDAAENEFSVVKGFRIFSVYKIAEGVTIWVITERDRSATTLLLPSEY